jgi:hypothetical protein
VGWIFICLAAGPSTTAFVNFISGPPALSAGKEFWIVFDVRISSSLFRSMRIFDTMHKCTSPEYLKPFHFILTPRVSCDRRYGRLATIPHSPLPKQAAPIYRDRWGYFGVLFLERPLTISG